MTTPLSARTSISGGTKDTSSRSIRSIADRGASTTSSRGLKSRASTYGPRYAAQRWAELLDEHTHFSLSASAIVPPTVALGEMVEEAESTARSLMRAEETGRPTRVGIPTEIRRAVFERDGGRCVECGSNFDLQYDHVLPVSRGGATTVQNLQLLCADCNSRKSDSL